VLARRFRDSIFSYDTSFASYSYDTSFASYSYDTSFASSVISVLPAKSREMGQPLFAS
jgi:hypothetical protein